MRHDNDSQKLSFFYKSFIFVWAMTQQRVVVFILTYFFLIFFINFCRRE